MERELATERVSIIPSPSKSTLKAELSSLARLMSEVRIG